MTRIAEIILEALRRIGLVCYLSAAALLLGLLYLIFASPLLFVLYLILRSVL